MILRIGGQPQFSRTVPGFVPVWPALLVGFCLLPGCRWLPIAVWRAPSDIWYWCLGKVYPDPGFFFPLWFGLYVLRAIFPLHQNEVWSLVRGLGRKFAFFFLNHITLLSQEEDRHTERLPSAPRQGCLEGESALSPLRIFGDISECSHVIFRSIKVVVEKNERKKCR